MPEQFWDLTMREFRLMQMGYLAELKDSQMHDWNLVRSMGTFVLQPHLKKGKSLKPKDLIPLPIDDEIVKEEDGKKRRIDALFAIKRRELIKQRNAKNPESSKLGLFDKRQN